MTSPTTEPTGTGPRLLVLGAGGRLGRLLARAWALDGARGVTLQSRQALDMAGSVRLDPLAEPAALAEAARGHEAILSLAGVTPASDGGDYGLNTVLAQAALEAARQAGVPRVFLASSAAVYGAADGVHEEGDALRPAGAYGAAKVRMEEAAREWAADHPRVRPVLLRIGNVAGADQLLGPSVDATRMGAPADLERFADGMVPRRAYIGPRALARSCLALAAARDLPEVLNVALPGVVGMDALLDAAGVPWRARPAPDTAIPKVALSVTRLAAVWGGLPRRAVAAEIVADLQAACGVPAA